MVGEDVLGYVLLPEYSASSEEVSGSDLWGEYCRWLCYVVVVIVKLMKVGIIEIVCKRNI